MDRTVLLVGFGNMGRALVQGWLARGQDPAKIQVVDPGAEAASEARTLGLNVAAANVAEIDAGLHPEVVVLAVKPVQLQSVARDCQSLVERHAGLLFMSVAAGKPMASVTGELGDVALVRVMPNTPAAIGQGVSVLVANGHVLPAQRRAATELMEAVGHVEWLDDEQLMDVVTAVSGSGPAYVFLLIEALVAAAIAAGLDEALAQRLATQTVAGSGAYASQSNRDAATLRARVTSPGGTTEAALQVLMSDNGMSAALMRAVQAAAVRSRELSVDHPTG